MPFPLPPLWNPASVWAPKSDLNPVPGGQANNYWASAESNFLSGALVQASGALTGAFDDVNTLSASLGLAADPTVGFAYTASYSASLLVSEVWKSLGTGNRIRELDYTYAGQTLVTSSAAVFDAADGTTVLAAATASFFYSGTFLVSASLVRAV